MVFGLPSIGESSWGQKILDSINFLKSEQDGRLSNASLTASYVGFDLRPSGDISGVTDRAAFNNLMTAAASGLRQKQVVVAPGIYYFDTTPSALSSGLHLVCLGGGETAGAAHGATFRYVGPAALRFVDARNCIGLTFSGIRLEGGGSFNGTLLDLAGAQFVKMTDGNLAGQGTARPARGVDLKGTNQITFTRVNFTTLVDGVRGITNTSGEYSEIIRFYDCNFGTNGGGELSGVALRNPNTDWLCVGCNFQPSTLGAPCAVGFDSLLYPAQGLTFLGCWWGDITTAYAGTAPWLDCRGLVNGITILSGNATMGSSAPLVQVGGGGNQFGLVIKGLTANAVPGGTSSTFVALGGGSFGEIDITGINYVGTWGSNPVTGTPGGGGALIQQPRGGITTKGFGLLASQSYNPAVYALTALGTTDGDVDATNLAVTFTAPPSGAVVIKVEALLVVDPGQDVHLTLRSGTTKVADQRVMFTAAAAQATQLRVPFTNKLTGLTPGTSYTYKLGGYTTTAGTGAKVGYGDGGGATLGPVVLEAWAA